MYAQLVVLALALGLTSSASAAPLAFSGTIQIEVGDLPTVTATGSGVGDSSGGGGAASIPAGVFAIVTTVAINPPLLVIDGFGVGAPGQIGTGQLPLAPGTNKALTFGGVTGTMSLDLSAYLITGYSNGAGTNPNNQAAIPLKIVGQGCGPPFFCPFPPVLGGLVMGTVKANPYQLGMVTVMGALNGSPSTVMGTGFDNRTAGGAGVLQLVSPTIVALGALGSLASLATLTVNFVPEPAAALLVVLGLAGLGAMRRRTGS